MVISVLFAIYRRHVMRPKRLEVEGHSSLDATVILLTILFIMVSMVGQNAARMVMQAAADSDGRFLSWLLRPVFESMNIKTKRADTDAIISNASSNKPFMDSSSDCPPGADTLPAGKKAYVASLIEGAPSDKEARTSIYLCTKEDVDGTCVNVIVKFTLP